MSNEALEQTRNIVMEAIVRTYLAQKRSYSEQRREFLRRRREHPHTQQQEVTLSEPTGSSHEGAIAPTTICATTESFPGFSFRVPPELVLSKISNAERGAGGASLGAVGMVDGPLQSVCSVPSRLLSAQNSIHTMMGGFGMTLHSPDAVGIPPILVDGSRVLYQSSLGELNHPTPKADRKAHSYSPFTPAPSPPLHYEESLLLAKTDPHAAVSFNHSSMTPLIDTVSPPSDALVALAEAYHHHAPTNKRRDASIPVMWSNAIDFASSTWAHRSFNTGAPSVIVSFAEPDDPSVSVSPTTLQRPQLQDPSLSSPPAVAAATEQLPQHSPMSGESQIQPSEHATDSAILTLVNHVKSPQTPSVGEINVPIAGMLSSSLHLGASGSINPHAGSGDPHSASCMSDETAVMSLIPTYKRAMASSSPMPEEEAVVVASNATAGIVQQLDDDHNKSIDEDDPLQSSNSGVVLRSNVTNESFGTQLKTFANNNNNNSSTDQALPTTTSSGSKKPQTVLKKNLPSGVEESRSLHSPQGAVSGSGEGSHHKIRDDNHSQAVVNVRSITGSSKGGGSAEAAEEDNTDSGWAHGQHMRLRMKEFAKRHGQIRPFSPQIALTEAAARRGTEERFQTPPLQNSRPASSASRPPSRGSSPSRPPTAGSVDTLRQRVLLRREQLGASPDVTASADRVVAMRGTLRRATKQQEMARLSTEERPGSAARTCAIIAEQSPHPTRSVTRVLHSFTDRVPPRMRRSPTPTNVSHNNSNPSPITGTAVLLPNQNHSYSTTGPSSSAPMSSPSATVSHVRTLKTALLTPCQAQKMKQERASAKGRLMYEPTDSVARRIRASCSKKPLSLVKQYDDPTVSSGATGEADGASAIGKDANTTEQLQLLLQKSSSAQKVSYVTFGALPTTQGASRIVSQAEVDFLRRMLVLYEAM